MADKVTSFDCILILASNFSIGTKKWILGKKS